jgi:hypothetical protein
VFPVSIHSLLFMDIRRHVTIIGNIQRICILI